MRNRLCLYAVLFGCNPATQALADDSVVAEIRQQRPVVTVQPDGLYVCEAEEFQSSADEGWTARRWGENYYAATFANSFLSRKAFLAAPKQCADAVASIAVDIEAAGRYLVLVRYEAAYRFETQFRVQVEQNGRQVFDRIYGARENLKIWAFGQKLQQEVAWSWGAVENIVWEGHDALVDLHPGPATIRLIAGDQPEPAARRHVDLVMLTTDVEQVRDRIERESYLPLDGMLTQSGDVWLRVENLGDDLLTFTGKRATGAGAGNWQQHSPYWVHLRNWAAPSIAVAPGATSEWIEVGGTMDSLNDGQWFWTGDRPFRAEFGLRNRDGRIEAIAEFTGDGDLALAADADTRHSRRLRRLQDVLYELLADLRQADPAPHGRVPQRTPIYASTFSPLDEGMHAAAVAEFKQLFGLSDPDAETPGGRGYIDVRGVRTPMLEDHCRNLGDAADGISVVSLGDEISLPTPGGADAGEGFHAWLEAVGVSPEEVLPGAEDWSRINYGIDESLKESAPGVYYWSKRYQYHYGIQSIKERTDTLRRHLPNAGIGANYSPHYPQQHMFLGEVFKWVTVFRESGMTLPWSEDYIWQVPVGTPQMNNINLDLFRAGLRHHPDREIMYYVMPHMPNNTPDQWRRLFYGALGHGMTMVNLFEFRPVHVAYTENHVDDPAMYRMILRSFRELGLFEDIVQDGRVRPARAAMWFSETGDIWGDCHGSFAAAKRGLYTAIRHHQIPLDFVVEEDALDGTLSEYRVLYLTDAHVSTAASRKISEWVEHGGHLFATAGAGMFDELDRPNRTLRRLLGVEQTELYAPEDAQLIWIKQDLPFTDAIDSARNREAADLPVFCVRSHVDLTDADSLWTFQDDSPAVTRNKFGNGLATYCAFLPALTYYRPAIPLRPVDRGATDAAMIHFLPTGFDSLAGELVASPAADLSMPVKCSEPLVETTVIESAHGVVIPLVNWSGAPVRDLRVVVSISTPTANVSLASGGTVRHEAGDVRSTFSFDLDVADALILRN